MGGMRKGALRDRGPLGEAGHRADRPGGRPIRAAPPNPASRQGAGFVGGTIAGTHKPVIRRTAPIKHAPCQSAEQNRLRRKRRSASVFNGMIKSVAASAHISFVENALIGCKNEFPIGRRPR